ncbi:MAG: CRISPR-associated endonuclease Cas1, partial [Thaumarchaeota archaeon]|nr:CRISPR-associated endonuclease Cas1 [Nitrososphaerota archaeon]
SGKGYVSTEALGILSENNRNLVLVDVTGRLLTVLNPVRSSLTATQYRIGQYDTFRDEKKREYLCKQIVKAKLDSQIRFLKLTERKEIQKEITKLESFRNKLDGNMIVNEAVSSRVYFLTYSKLIDSRFEFKSRNSIFISKQDASDVINVLLNYGYAVLASEIAKFVNGVGLDPYYGFYHKNHTSFQSLVYDMMEPFRWLVEYAVWKISEAKSRNRISRKQYSYTREGFVVLEYELIRKFLELLERTFQKERRYDYKFGLKTEDGLKSVQEITIAKIAIQNLVEYCTEKQIKFRI